MPVDTPIAAGVRVGHVHLKVADLDRAIGFYGGVLGFAVMQRMGSQAAFLSAGGYHHHIGLNTWESKAAPHPLLARRGCSTLRSSIRTGQASPMRCGG